ncbi:MAG: AmmeMemoRadiSam system protein B [Spirochaetia bacterium]
MIVRKRLLPPGWYPSGADNTIDAIEAMSRRLPARPEGQGVAGVVPHAGWEFSGCLALEVMSYLSRSIDTIVIIGGHLGPSDGILCSMEDSFETPLGPMPADGELREALRASFPMREDLCADNSVEVQLPFAKHLFPDARLLSLRASPSEEAVRLGAAIASAAKASGRKVAVIGSTDLTHYGPNYGFSPMGKGEKARVWVRDVNDRRIIQALVAMDCASVHELAGKERSACSAGGALCAVSFAREMGVRKGQLLRYMTSYDVHPADSFVGYAGVLYGPQ